MMYAVHSSSHDVCIWNLEPLDEKENKIWATQMTMERKMLGVRWEEKRTNASSREEMELPDILMRIKDYKWKWAGHKARADRNNTWYGCMKDWIPSGKRKRGRPRKRWEDDIRQFAGPDWTEKATDISGRTKRRPISSRGATVVVA